MRNVYFLAFIAYVFSQQVEPLNPLTCPSECGTYYVCDTQLGKCVYKGFWPIYPLEMVEILVLSTSSALATACGIGGGTVYSAFLLGIQKFEPLEAFPISNCLILSCGLVTFIACVLDKYDNPKNKFVDYDMAILFGPSMLLGAKFGTIFNKIFSSLFLTIAVLLVLCYSVRSTYKNVQKAKEREAQYEREQAQTVSLETNHAEPLISKDDKAPNVREMIRYEGADRVLSAEEERILHEDDNPLRLDRITFMIILEFVIIIDQFLEGNAKLNSFIGIPRCSMTYWIIFVGYIFISLLLLWVAYQMVLSHYRVKKEIVPNFKSNRMETISNHIIRIIIVATIAGIVSSMVGIGGGMITNPLFATLGLDPKESSSTSNFLIITTAIASTFLFSFAGQLNYSFVMWMVIPCTIAAFIGSFLILQYINRTKRSSILLVIMLYFLIASGFIIVVKGYFDLQVVSVLDVIKINNYC